MSMIDGVLLLVDAAEGPMAQTKFVLMKALRRCPLRPSRVPFPPPPCPASAPGRASGGARAGLGPAPAPDHVV